MNNNGRLNNIFKLLGIIFILLSITVFARAETYSFTCNDPFNCSIKSYCQSVPGAVPGLLVHYGTATSYALGSQPIEYSFHSTQPGTNICSIIVKLSAFHSQGQSNEVTALYVNGEHVGTTSDNYCNGPSTENCTFCGIDTQNLGQKTIVLQENNVLKIYGYESHAVVGVTLDCTKQFDPDSCEYNKSPIIRQISNKIIKYNSSFSIDLWDYASDPDDRLSDLEFTFNVNNDNLVCSLNDNRYLNCSSSLLLGNTIIEVTATDDCDASAKREFVVTIENNPPTINIPDFEKSCSANLIKFIDLRDYSNDEEKNLLEYSIVSQSNNDLISCSIVDEHYLSCIINICDNNYSDISIRTEDIFSEYDETTFRISIKDFPPYLKKSIPDFCINVDTVNLLNLKEYFFDSEDGNNLNFTLLQDSQNDIVCSLNNSFVSCNINTNAKTFNEIEIIARDSANNSIKESFLVETMCFENKKFDFSSEQKFFCLEDCTSHTQELTLTNNSEYTCFDFELEHDEYLNATLSNSSFCMNKNESRKIYLNVNTCNADRAFYDIKVKDYENDIELNFEYQIGNCTYFGEIEVREFDGFICNNTKKDFVVTIKNNSIEEKTFVLNAENQLLLPYFSRDQINIPAFSSREVMLTINAKNVLGKQNIQLSATTGNEHIEKRLIVDVKDCSDIKERNFLIETPSVCFDVAKGQIFEGSFNVRRVSNDCIDCSFNEKSVKLSMYGLQNELSNNIVSLSGTTSQKVYYSLKIPSDASAGTRFITVSGQELPEGPFAETGFVQDETICLNVLGTSSSSINLRTESKDIVWCDSEIFELEIINDGDFDETFSLSTLQKPVGVNVIFSEQQVTVPKKSSKIIYVSVSTTTDSSIAENQSILIKLDGRLKLESRIYFNIVEKPFFDNVEIMSYTQLIEMNSNSEKIYYIQVRNNTDFEIKNIQLSFENTPNGIEIEKKFIDSIKPKEVLTLSGKIVSNDVNGSFSTFFVLEKVIEGLPNQLLNKKEFQINVQSPSSQNVFTGLFGFNLLGFDDNGSSGFFIFIGVMGLLTFLLLIVILSVVFSASYSEKKEVWVGVKE